MSVDVKSATFEKAQELVEQNRVILQPRLLWTAIVAGEHAHYRVEFKTNGPECPCPSRLEWCSHALAAAVAFADDAERLEKMPW